MELVPGHVAAYIPACGLGEKVWVCVEGRRKEGELKRDGPAGDWTSLRVHRAPPRPHPLPPQHPLPHTPHAHLFLLPLNPTRQVRCRQVVTFFPSFLLHPGPTPRVRVRCPGLLPSFLPPTHHHTPNPNQPCGRHQQQQPSSSSRQPPPSFSQPMPPPRWPKGATAATTPTRCVRQITHPPTNPHPNPNPTNPHTHTSNPKTKQPNTNSNIRPCRRLISAAALQQQIDVNEKAQSPAQVG